MSTLACKNVAYAYEKGKGILTNISFSFESGKMYAILGPSGSWKNNATFLGLAGLIRQRKEISSLMILTSHKQGWKNIGETTYR